MARSQTLPYGIPSPSIDSDPRLQSIPFTFAAPRGVQLRNSERLLGVYSHFMRDGGLDLRAVPKLRVTPLRLLGHVCWVD